MKKDRGVVQHLALQDIDPVEILIGEGEGREDYSTRAEIPYTSWRVK